MDLYKDILICILNYRQDANAMRWKKLLGDDFTAVVLDSGNDHTVEGFTQYPNIYYSGLWNEFKKLMDSGKYTWGGIITSDIKIDDRNAAKLIDRLKWLKKTRNLGIYSVMGDLKGHTHKYVYGESVYGTFRYLEGFFQIIKKEVVDAQPYVDTSVNLYGYGIDYITSFLSRKLGYVNYADEDIYMFHPLDKGYDKSEANRQRVTFYEKIRDYKGLEDFEFKYNSLNSRRNDVDGINMIEVNDKGLSVIICYTDKNKCEEVYSHIKSSTTCDTELLSFDNIESKLPICEVYNLLGSKAKYDVLLFVHQDVIFSGDGIDKIVKKVDEDDKCGAVGFAGGKARLKNQITSWKTGDNSLNVTNYHEYVKGKDVAVRYNGKNKDNIKDDFINAVCLDGLALFVNKKNFNAVRFDDNLLRGFHGYDLDFTLCLTKNGFNNYVYMNQDVCATHYSSGSFGYDWMRTIIMITNYKWNKFLPIFSEDARINDTVIDNIRTGSDIMFKRRFDSLSEEEKIKIKKYIKGISKKVIYTCITGNYDNLTEPKTIYDDIDFVCFTDNADLKSDIWQIRAIPSELSGLSDVKKQRCIKINPHKYLSEYNISIWVDANISVQSDINNLLSECVEGNVFIPRHPSRNCIYQEAYACLSWNKDSYDNIFNQIERYKSEGYPSQNGMVQTGIMLRHHNEPDCIKLMDTWWKEVKNGSHRDQLSFNYAIWKTGVRMKYLNKFLFYSQYFMLKNGHAVQNSPKITNVQNNIVRNTSTNVVKKQDKMHLDTKEKNKYVVYTCITGNYDKISNVNNINGVDFVCFTDNNSLSVSGWQMKPIPSELSSFSNTLKSRYVKLNPHKYLSEYDVSVWVDGNVDITGDIKGFIDKTLSANSGKCIMAAPHPIRKCVYRESNIDILMNKEAKDRAESQMLAYKNEGYPAQNGLYQTNILIRRHNDKECVKVMGIWWNEVSKRSTRDTLSFNYALWKAGVKGIGEFDKFTYNSECFKWRMSHLTPSQQKQTKSPSIQKNVNKIKIFAR